MAGGVGERAAVGPAQPAQPGDPPVELVAGQHAAGDQVPGLRRDALVVVADGGQAVRAVRSPVTFITGEPYCRVPSWSGVANEVPA